MIKREALFAVGQRVGIVSGVQSVSGPWIADHGTVVRHEEYWRGSLEYVVQQDSNGAELIYPPYLLRAL